MISKNHKNQADKDEADSEGSVSVGLSCFSEYTAFGHVS